MTKIFASLKKIPWFRIIIVLLPPIILSWPLVGGVAPFPRKAYISFNTEETISKVDESPQKVIIPGLSQEVGAVNIFSRLLKIETRPMPIEFCIRNENAIIEDGKPVDRAKLIDGEQAGAMSIKYVTPSGSEDSVYVQINDEQCRDLPVEGIYLKGEIEVKNPFPVDIKVDGEHLIVKENIKREILLNKKLGVYQIKWQWEIFLGNFVVLVFGWWVFLASSFAIWRFIKEGIKKSPLR